MKSKPNYISQPIDLFLLKLYNRKGIPENPFKQNGSKENVRFKSGDELYDWFSRSVDSVGGLNNVIIDDNIAIFPFVNIKDREIANMSLQVLATIDCKITDYRDNESSAAYFRLDYHPKEIGRIFSHPMPHIHISNKYDARMPFAIESPSTCILDFIEFLYINFYYEKWLSWAKDVWQKGLMTNLNDPYDSDNYLDVIQEGLLNGRIIDNSFVNKYGDSIKKFKRMLFNEKKEESQKLVTIPTTCLLINYLGLSDDD